MSSDLPSTPRHPGGCGGRRCLQEQTSGTDPLDRDTDDDRYEDGVEGRAGTDPLDPDSVPAAAGLPALGALGQLLTALLVLLVGLGAAARRPLAADRAEVQNGPHERSR